MVLTEIFFTEEQIKYINNAFPADPPYEEINYAQYEYDSYEKIEELVEAGAQQLIKDKNIYVPAKPKPTYFKEALPIKAFFKLPRLGGSSTYYFFHSVTGSNIYESTEHLKLYSFGTIWVRQGWSYDEVGGLALVNATKNTITLFCVAKSNDSFYIHGPTLFYHKGYHSFLPEAT